MGMLLLQAELHTIFEQHNGFKALRMIRKKENLLVFVEYDFSQAAYDAVDEFSDGFVIRSSRTHGVVELAKDDRRPQQQPRASQRIQPRQIIRRSSEPIGVSAPHTDRSISPKNKREEGENATEGLKKKKSRSSPSSSSSESSSSSSDSSTSSSRKSED